MPRSAGSPQQHAVIAVVIGLIAFGAAAQLLRPKTPPPAPVVAPVEAPVEAPAEPVVELPISEQEPLPAELLGEGTAQPFDVDAARALGAGTASMHARVFGPDGSPLLCGATLYRVVSPGVRALTPNSTRTCEPDGNLRYDKLAAGEWRLMVQGSGTTLWDVSFTVAEGQTVELGDQQLKDGGRVAGRVTKDGQPVPKAQVRSSAGHAILADDFGRYRVDGAPVGEVLVRALKDGWGGGGTVVVEKGKTLTYDIELAQLPPRGFVGLKLDAKDGAVVVSGVTPKSPAEGVVQAGDIVVSVAGEAVTGDVDRVRKLAAGPPGEPLTLQVRRGDKVLDLTLTRATIEVSR
ncbi:MAG: hypothetical protein RIT28_2978 [Pseudomonadota bacterium]